MQVMVESFVNGIPATSPINQKDAGDRRLILLLVKTTSPSSVHLNAKVFLASQFQNPRLNFLTYLQVQ